MTLPISAIAEGRFNLNAILCGAEGTLGFIAEAELNVLPIPQLLGADQHPLRQLRRRLA